MRDLPHTIAFVVRKRQQVDGFNELPSEKRPPDLMIWDGTGEEIEDWLDKVLRNKQPQIAEFVIDKVEGA